MCTSIELGKDELALSFGFKTHKLTVFRPVFSEGPHLDEISGPFKWCPFHIVLGRILFLVLVREEALKN